MTNKITASDLEKLSHNKQVRFALFCAYQVEHLWKEFPECVSAIKTTELFLEGKASNEECSAYASAAAAYAAYAAYAAANAAASASAYAAAYAAASAAYAAAYAASDKNKILKEQSDFYDQLLNGDKYFEEILLK